MSNTNNLTDYVLMPGPDYQDMCNAIREKTGIAGDIISSQIGDIIRNIQGSVVLPKYTIKFYNNTTLLQTNENVVYGSSINYTGIEPTKNGYTFDRFEPSGARITGDTNCYAQFIENVVEPEEPTTGEWVPFCTDGVTWTGEEIDIANTGKGVRPAEYIGAVVISPTNQYRFTLGEDVYEGVNIDEYGKGIALENCPYYLKTLNAPTYRFNFISDADLYYTGPLKVEAWTGSEPYMPEEPEVVPELLSWDGVSYHIEHGDYKDVYSIGDEIPLDLGSEGVINMQIAAFDTDTLADGSGTAAITWIAKELLKTKKKWNSTYEPTQSNGSYLEGTGTIGGWEKSLLRTYLRDNIYSLIPTTAKCLIRNVTKSHGAYDTTGARFTQTTEENVWIPNYDEVIKTDCTYKALFPDNSSKVKYLVSGGSAQKWWTRGAGGDSFVYIITTSGAGDAFGANNKYGVCIAFCTGVTQNADQGGGYVPTDGYQAFTTDGTWTGEEVTTAGATDWLSSDLRWVGDTSTTIEEGMNILVTVNGVQYNCSVTSAGRPKVRYVIASDGCPVTIEGGCDFTAYWAVFPTAGTYTLKVEVPTDSQEVDCATFIPFADLTIASGSLLNFQVSWGERPYEEFEGYLDGNADIAAYSYYDGRARGYVVRLTNNGDADLTVSSDVTYTIIITNVIVE